MEGFKVRSTAKIAPAAAVSSSLILNQCRFNNSSSLARPFVEMVKTIGNPSPGQCTTLTWADSVC